MDTGPLNCSSKMKYRSSFQGRLFRSKNSQENLDRFIPNRSAMDFGYAHYMLTEGNKKGREKENDAVMSPSREAYQKQLAEAFNMNRTRILAFKNKPPTPVELIPKCILSPPPPSNFSKSRRCVPQSFERTLDAPETYWTGVAAMFLVLPLGTVCIYGMPIIAPLLNLSLWKRKMVLLQV